MNWLCKSLIILVGLILTSGSLFAQRNLKVIPPPDPELERKTFILPEGFEVNLFAADPQIAKPIQMNFDPQGRLWIASSETYPHIEPGAVANDKVLYLHDVDGDGVSDRTQIFADGLLIPTGVAPGMDGVFVGASTELLHFQDTDGDGRADKKSIVLSGFGTEDTHHIIHTLGYGPASHLYFNQSIYIHSHIETPWGIRRLNAGGIWRFRPETLELSVLARGLVNPWGTDFDRFGQTFATDGAGGEGINYIVPGAYYTTAYGAQRILHGLNPGSPKHCGLEIVESEHLPDDWQGSLLTNDFRGHRVCRFVLTEDGSGYRSQEQQEVIKSDHVAFRPVDIKQGPDGAIYIADWYNPIIQHGEVDFRDERRDHTHGRIWRVTYTGKPNLASIDLTKLSNTELLDHVASRDKHYRQQAKFVLKERGEDILPDVDRWVAESRTSTQKDQIVLEGLWIHQSIGHLCHDCLGECLLSSDHRIRAAATRVIGQMLSQVRDPLELLRERIVDSHPQVRLEAIRALAEVKQPETIQVALQALNFSVDRNIDYALWLTCRDLEPVWTGPLTRGEIDLDSPPQALPFLLRSTGSAAGTSTLISRLEQSSLKGQAFDDAVDVVADIGTKEHLGKLFDFALQNETPVESKIAYLQALIDAARSRKVVPIRNLAEVQPYLKASDPALRAVAIEFIGAAKVEWLRAAVSSIAQNSDQEIADRVLAVRAVGEFSNQPAAKLLTEIISGDDPVELRRAALIELVRFRPNQAPDLIVEFLKSAESETVTPLFQAILQRKGASDLLAKAIDGETVPKDVAIVGARVLSSSGQQESTLAKLLRKAGQLQTDPVKLSAAEMTELVEEVRTSGDPHRGEKVFRRTDLNCLKCHAIGPAGGQIGSNLLSLGATAQPDYIIESLLDPNAKVKEGFHTVVVATDDGKILSGIKARETDAQLFLKDADGKEIVVDKDAIEQEKQGTSLMPAGLTSNITHQELLDLSAFLSALGRLPEFTISTDQLVRHWETIQATPEAAYQFRRTSYADAATDNPAFNWQKIYSHVSGELQLAELPEVVVRNRVAAGNRGMSFVRTKFRSDAGEVNLSLNDATGLQIWLDEKPVDPSEQLVVPVDKGEHQITIAIDLSLRTKPLILKPESSSQPLIELPTGK